MRTLVKGGLIVTFIHEGYHSIKMKYADLLIEDDTILDIREEIADGTAHRVDAHGLWVLPGLIDVGSSVVGAVLGSGLLPDYSRARWQGEMLHGRALPLLETAAEALTSAGKRALARFGLTQLLLSGATTVADLTHPAFAAAVRAEGEALGLRLRVFPERTASGYPIAAHSGKLDVPKREGGRFAQGDALFSVETTSPRMYEAARRSAGPLLVRGAYSEYEKQLSRLAFGLSPIGKLNEERLLSPRTVVVGGAQADFFDRERLRTAGATLAMSAVEAMQDGHGFPIVQNLRQDVNTCLSTGFYGLSMLGEMRQAAFAGKLDSNASQFQASDAFYAATIAGAQGLGEKTGRLEPGFAADLLLVNPTRLGPNNYPLIALVYRAECADIVGRMAAGKMLPMPDLHKAARKAQAAAERAWAAAAL